MTLNPNSIAANRAITESGVKAKHKQKVLEAFRTAIHEYKEDGTPITSLDCKILIAHCAGTYQNIAMEAEGLSEEQCRKRLPQLADEDGMIYRTELPGFTSSGCKCTVWALTDKGREALSIPLKTDLFA